ncbi:vitamin K epoxide reductase family protein [Leucobacter sp. GX24907]
MTATGTGTRPPIGFAVSTIVLGVIGWFASFELLTEYISTLVNPAHVPNCNINPLVTCGPNMESWQGSIFGFSNTIIGVSAFVAPVAVGVALLAGARFAPWFWRLYQLGLLGGFALICWLSYQSVFNLGTMCPWCMVVWTVMIPLFWSTLFRPTAVGDVPAGHMLTRFSQTMHSWTWVLVLVTYIIIAAMAQFQLSWIPRAFL